MPETTRVGAGGRPFSRGQEQRLALAAALGSDTPLLLLDEPTAHLDVASTRRVAEGILAAARGRTLVVATHDARSASICDVVVDLEALAREPECVDEWDTVAPLPPHRLARFRLTPREHKEGQSLFMLGPQRRRFDPRRLAKSGFTGRCGDSKEDSPYFKSAGRAGLTLRGGGVEAKP